MIGKSIRLAITAAAVALLVFTVIGAPASAHQTEVSQGKDFAVTATDHKSGTVCDMERDGHAVFADWYNDFGTRIATASDGGDSGCDEVSFHGEADTVVVCEAWLGGAKCSDSHKV